MAKILGFILGIIVAVAGPAAFGVLASGGDLKLSAHEFALVFIVWGLALWLAVSLFSGAGALGAGLTFAAMTYLVHFQPNRMTHYLNKVPGSRSSMIDGIKASVLDGLVPVLGVITLVFSIQLMAYAVRRRRLQREEEERLDAERDENPQLVPAGGVRYDAPTSQYPQQQSGRFTTPGGGYGGRPDEQATEPVPAGEHTQVIGQPDDATRQFGSDAGRRP